LQRDLQSSKTKGTERSLHRRVKQRSADEEKATKRYIGVKKLWTQEKCVDGETLSIFQRNRLPIEMASQPTSRLFIHPYMDAMRCPMTLRPRKDGPQEPLLIYGPVDDVATLTDPNEAIPCLVKTKIEPSPV
jgi:hypothetical protein